MPSVTVTLPVPPSANHRLLRGRGGRVILSEAARSYTDLVAVALAGNRPTIPARTPLSLQVTFVCPNRRRDLDNILKQLIDSLATVLGFNDAWIDRIDATKCVSRQETPHVTVTLSWHDARNRVR